MSTISSPAHNSSEPIPTATFLRMANVSKSYGSKQVLGGIDLALDNGRTLAIVGPSGSGKTTLLRLIAGFQAPDTGSIEVGGRDVIRPWIPAHQREIGYVAQDGALFPHLSVAQNIAFGLGGRWTRTGRRERGRIVAELLDMVSLEAAVGSRYPHEISGGQQQRVALARALARKPKLMLLDEPFSALDAGLRVSTRKAVAQVLAEAAVSTILVTHDQSEALSFADQVAVMRGGRMAQSGTPFSVYTRPADLDTAEFLGDAVMLDAHLQGSLATCALGGIPVRHATVQGPVRLMLRPEQIRITADGPIRGTVVDTVFFGPDAEVRIQLDPVPGGQGQIISIRHWNAAMARPGMELNLRVVGEGVAFPL